LILGERDYAEAADDDQWRLGEERFGFDGGEGFRRLKPLANFDFDDGDFGIDGVHAKDGAGADGSALIAGVVEDPLGALRHLAQVHYSGWVVDAIPDGFLVAEKIVEGVLVGFGLEEKVGHVGSIVCEELGIRELKTCT
jgi:hypothetical protein